MSMYKATRYAAPWMNRTVTAVAWCSVVMLLGMLWHFAVNMEAGKGTVRREAAAGWLWIWGLFPPVFFWVEYHLMWRPSQVAPLSDPERRAAFEEFKYSHEVGRNIWLAVVAGLAAVYNFS